MKKKSFTRAAGVLLCLALALSLLPFGAFAVNLGTYTLDLSSGSTVTLNAAEGEAVSRTLTKAKDAGLISMTKGTATATSMVVYFDLDRDGTNDLDVKATIKSGKTQKVAFKANSGGSVHGDVPLTVPYTGSEDYYTKLTMKFPKAIATLTAQVTFNANGGTGEMPKVTVVKNKNYTLPDCGFTAPEGKAFDKWDLGAPGDSVTITKDTVVTAQWKDKDATPKNIDTIEITFIDTDLKAGQKPNFAAALSPASAAMATVKEEHWIDETAGRILSSDGTEWTIEEGHSYSYGLTLEAKDGYVFSESTSLSYDSANYPLSAIGYTLHVTGATLQLWDFAPEVDVIGDAVDRLELDLTKGGTSVAEPRCTALDNTLTGANAVSQVKYAGGAVDLDRDGTIDLSFDKTSGVMKLQPTMSLTEDFTLTLSGEGISYVTGKALTPYAKAVVFKMAPAARAYELDLSGEAVTLTGDEAEALINALQADDGALVRLTKSGASYLVDLDLDGKDDMKVTESGGAVTAERLETNSVAEKIALTTPLYKVIQQAAGSAPYLTHLTVKFKESEPPKDLGALTIDLSKNASVTLAQPQFEAFRASAGGLNFTHAIRAVTSGDFIKYDLDNDSVFDVQAEKKADGSGVFTVLESCTVSGARKLTVGAPELSVINATGSKAYYKDVTFKLPGAGPNPFLDVQESDYFYDAVLWAYYSDPQITVGVDDTHFGPDKTVTRGQCVTFLWRAMGEPEPTITVNPFADVSESEYWYKAILWAVEKGITVGTDATHFSPARTLSTHHIVTFLYRTLNPGMGGPNAGWDGEAEAWARENDPNHTNLPFGVNIAVSDSTPCPRADVVTFLYEALT